MSVPSLEDYFEHELQEILGAERQVLQALPKLINAVESDELAEVFEDHMDETEDQVDRLETIFRLLNKAARELHCYGMEELLRERDTLIEEEEFGPGLDAQLICAARKIEQYEIAWYGSLVDYAKLLEYGEVRELLETSLAAEKAADEQLSEIASELNLMAQAKATE